MSFLKKIITHSLFIPTIAITLSSLLIWFAGPYIAIADNVPLGEAINRIVAILLILLSFMFYKLLKFQFAAKANKDMVADIVEENNLGESIDAESGELKQKFEQAFSLLKSSSGKVNTLTEIPWYMIIGTPGCGKTTLLSNSGLNFPLAKEFSNQAIQGVGGTKNCDWWFTQEAVLLDTAGRYTSRDSHQEVDSAGWDNFLKLIKKYRKKPINGVLVSFSLSDLLTLNEFEMGQQVVQIKRRISELNSYFETQFPIYIVLTKCDMLAGFNQFYESFSHKEREQVCGLTFEKGSIKTQNLSSEFAAKYDALLQSMARRQWHRMSTERDASRKFLIYNFSNQLASLKPALKNIVEQLSNDDGVSRNGVVRGMYLTSGIQHGAPIDRIISSVSKVFGLKSSAQMLWNNDSRSYFIKDLLQQVIFPESNQFGVLAGYEKRKAMFSRSLIASSFVLTLAVCGAWAYSYKNNVDVIDNGTAGIKAWQTQYQDFSSGQDVTTYISALNDFLAYSEVVDQKGQSVFAGGGLNQTTALQGSIDASYTRLIRTALLPYIKVQTERELNNTFKAEEKYVALKAYLMLSNLEQRNDEFLTSWLDELIKEDSHYSEKEKLYLAAHARHIIDNKMKIDGFDQAVVDSARQDLKRMSLDDLYYQQFKNKYINDPQQMLSMSQLAGADWNSVFSVSRDELMTISKLYTPEMLKKVKLQLIAQHIAKLQKDSWIFGEANDFNPLKLTETFLKRYSNEYISEWKAVLASVKVNRSSSREGLERSLRASSSVNSPLISLLDSVAKATDLVKRDASSLLGEKVKQKSTTIEQISRLDRADPPEVVISTYFAKFHDLMATENKAFLSEKISAIMSEIALRLSIRDESGNNNLSAVKSLEEFAFSQPKPLRTWLGAIVKNVNGQSNKTKKRDIIEEWRLDYLPQCRDLVTNRYPFDKSASNNATARDLAALFSNTGLINDFFASRIKPFVNTNASPWRWKTSAYKKYGFSQDVLPFFEKAYKLKGALFDKSSEQASITMQFKPVHLSRNATKFAMKIYGTKMKYQFGSPTLTRVSWPPQDITPSSEYVFERKNDSDVLYREVGLYSLFKLLDNANIERVSSNQLNATFTDGTLEAIYEITGDNGVDPLILNLVSNFRCIESL